MTSTISVESTSSASLLVLNFVGEEHDVDQRCPRVANGSIGRRRASRRGAATDAAAWIGPNRPHPQYRAGLFDRSQTILEPALGRRLRSVPVGTRNPSAVSQGVAP